MNNSLLIILLLLLPQILTSQTNFVPNPSFEVYNNCPITSSQINFTFHWFQPNTCCGLGGSSDYFNLCNLGSVGIPNNGFGVQDPKSGVGYAGISPFNGTPLVDAGREYLEIKLKDSLIGEKKYCVSFYVSKAENVKYAIDAIGAYFSLDTILYYDNDWTKLPYTPQIANDSGNVISDTTNWTLIQGEFIAIGGERFITIGNFNTNLNTTIDTVGVGLYAAYYYIDDVFVMLCDDTCKAVPPVASFNSYNTDTFTVNFYNLSTATANNWLWYFGDGTSDTVQNPVHSYDSAGTYKVTFVACDSNCCNTFESEVAVGGVGINESVAISASKLRVYPNPSAGKINVQCSIANIQCSIKIYNILGETVYQAQTQNNTFQIDLSNEPEGIYYFCIYSHERIASTEKLLLVR